MGNFNNIVFPAPPPSYHQNDYFLYWIPTGDKKSKIPVVFYENM